MRAYLAALAAACVHFRELDADNSGSLAYEEVAERFATEAPKETSTRGMLLSMIWADESKEGRGSPTSRWTVRGKDVESVRMELQLLLAETAESGAGLAAQRVGEGSEALGASGWLGVSEGQRVGPATL